MALAVAWQVDLESVLVPGVISPRGFEVQVPARGGRLVHLEAGLLERLQLARAQLGEEGGLAAFAHADLHVRERDQTDVEHPEAAVVRDDPQCRPIALCWLPSHERSSYGPGARV